MTDDTILSPCPRALDPRDAEALAEIQRLRARIIEMESAIATMVGTLAKPTPDDDQPATYTHNVPPNAPR